MTPLRLIVGLGNPGNDYSHTRHNAGERWLRELAGRFAIPLNLDNTFAGFIGRGSILGRDLRLLVPTTYMNRSGDCVGSYARYFRIEPIETLIAYDEVAFPVGISKIKVGGGANGHNGVTSVIQGFGGEREFPRLRIGVGHPGNPDRMLSYLTGHDMPKEDLELSQASSDMSDELLEHTLNGDWQKAMTLQNTQPPEPQEDE